MWEIILLPFEENGHQLQQQQQKKQPSRQQEPLRPSSNYASSSITTAATTSSTPSFGSTHRNARDTTIHDTFEETSTKANELKEQRSLSRVRKIGHQIILMLHIRYYLLIASKNKGRNIKVETQQFKINRIWQSPL